MSEREQQLEQALAVCLTKIERTYDAARKGQYELSVFDMAGFELAMQQGKAALGEVSK